MIKFFIIILFLFINGCSTFEKENVECPKLTSPKNTAEIVVNSKNNQPVYMGFRGVQTFCFKDGDNIHMELSVNIRAIRSNITSEDYAPVNITVVSIGSNEKIYDRDKYSYSQFLIKGSKIVDRATKFYLKIPVGGRVLLGIK